MKQLSFFFTIGLLLNSIFIAHAQNTKLLVEGSFATAITTTASDLTLDETHQVVLVSSSTNRTITLPSATGTKGRKYTIKKIGTGDITVIPQSGQNIDNAGSFIIFGINSFLTIVSDGNNWWVVGRD